MALTKEYIEAIHDSADVGFAVTHEELAELCRLALLGLEREESRTEPEPQRDERAERIGRAVLAFIAENFDGVRHARMYAKYLKDSEFDTAANFFRAIADAMEEP